MSSSASPTLSNSTRPVSSVPNQRFGSGFAHTQPLHSWKPSTTRTDTPSHTKLVAGS